MKHLIILLLVFVFCPHGSAAVPIRWTVETSRVAPAQIEAYHGETLRFEASLQSYGKPFAPTNNLYAIYWQTNGMDSAYWVGPAVISNNVLLSEWIPAMDVGATAYQGFIGAPGEIYRASFQLRLRPSPGAVPSELPLPTKTLDFAQVTILNPPYYDRDETDARILELAPVPGNYSTVSNRAMNAVQPATIADMETQTHAAATYQPKGDYLTEESDPTVDAKILTATNETLAAAKDYTDGCATDLVERIAGKQDEITDLTTIRSGAALGATALQTETDPTVPSWAKAAVKPTYAWSEITSKPSWIGSTKPAYGIGEIAGLSGELSTRLSTTNLNNIASPIRINRDYFYDETIFDLSFNGGSSHLEIGVNGFTWNGVAVWWNQIAQKSEIPTALKCPNSITIKTNGVAAVTYDGSAAKTIDLALGGGGGGGPGGTVAAAALEYHADGQAIEVTVAAAGTFSATLTGWPDGQSQMAFVTLAAGASVSPSIKLIGYSEWTVGEEFMAVATRRGNKIYVNPVCITEE